MPCFLCSSSISLCRLVSLRGLMNLNLSQTVAQGIASNGLSGAAVLARLLTSSQLNLLVLFAIAIVLQLQLSITPVTFEPPPPPAHHFSPKYQLAQCTQGRKPVSRQLAIRVGLFANNNTVFLIWFLLQWKASHMLNVCKHVRKGDKCRVPPVQPVISHLSCSETPSNCGLPNGCTCNEHVYHHFHFCVACSFPDENACRSFVVVATDYSLHWSHFDCCQFAHA